MFSNLSQNSILYILDIKDKPKLVTGTVTNVSLPRPQYATFGQNPETVMDITVLVDGERREFKRVPSNTSIANFGADAFILADSADAVNQYLSSALQNSRNIVNSVERHKQLITDYEEILQNLNPAYRIDKEKDKAIQSLQSQVDELQKGMQQMLAIMTKGETKKI